MQKIKKIMLLVIAIILSVGTGTIFVGCGNSNKIRLNEVTHSIFYAPLYVALNMGFFNEEGLTVELESATGSDASMTALISNSADIALIGPEQVVYAENIKDKPVIFGQLTQTDGSFIVGKEASESFNLTDLIGKTIIGGRSGGLPAMTLEYVIKEAGLTIGTGENQVNLRTDVAFNMIASEFITSGNEYCTLFEPNATNLQKAGNGYVLQSVAKYAGQLPYTCFVAKSSFLSDNKDKAESFLKAVKKGYEYLISNSYTLSAQALQPSFSGMTIEELEIAVEEYLSINAWSSDMILSQASFNRLIDVLNSASDENYSPNYVNLVNNSFAENIKA
ncbi:MAG: ABC transporter substrate-binding protein [Clostridiales bacterium]|nr:ABC transporter substrate-binding protein [Clostridiales bacterium]